MASRIKEQPRSIGAFVSRMLHKDSSLGYILLAPGMIFLLLMMAYPFVYAVYLSFTNKAIGTQGEFVGLSNYTRLLGPRSLARR